jgi:hypothetical protein
VLVVVGVILSIGLALFSYVKVSSNGISYRSSETWSNEATLLFTQAGAPEYRSTLPPGRESATPPDRIATLVPLYAALVKSDPVAKPLEKRGLLDPAGVSSSIDAEGVVSSLGAPAPLMTLTATGISPAAATRLTVAATNSFIAFLEARQKNAQIPADERVEAQVVTQPSKPLLAKPRSKTGFVAILLAGLTLTVAAAFIRDNLQRTRRRTGVREANAVPLAAVHTPGEPAAPGMHVAATDEEAEAEGELPRRAAASSSRWTPS